MSAECCETKTYPCSFCGEPHRTKSARRRHNETCPKNVDREKNQRATAEVKKNRSARPSRGMDPDTFAEMFDDLPDGAFFAMAEEFGIQPEDFI